MNIPAAIGGTLTGLLLLVGVLICAPLALSAFDLAQGAAAAERALGTGGPSDDASIRAQACTSPTLARDGCRGVQVVRETGGEIYLTHPHRPLGILAPLELRARVELGDPVR